MIHIENLAFGYRQNPLLFDQLDLSLPAGSIYGLLGKNGAGKSSLLKLICGLLYPRKGQMSVVGYPPGHRLPGFLQEVYLVGEEFHLPAVTINSYIKLYGRFYPRFSRELFESYAMEFGLDAQKQLSDLSYGQKKKFLLSFGLATDCKLLILDEPTNGLDIPSKSQFRKVVASAIHEERSFIISTHQVRDMENLIDPVIILDDGEIVFFQSYEKMSEKLTITREAQMPVEQGLVYSESTFGGHTVVRENTTGEETHLNLEVVFNAVVNSKEKMYELFKN